MKAIKLRIIIMLAVMLISGTTVFAQDIIMLKSGEDIEAVVEKVGGTEIEYKKWNNQTGPIYTIKKSDVFMIKYRNGTKDLFNQSEKPSENIVEQPKQNYTPPSNPQNNNTQPNNVPNQSTPANITTNNVPNQSTYSNNNAQSQNNLYRQYNCLAMSKEQLRYDMQINDIRLYNKYNKGRKLATAGNALLITAGGLGLASIISFGCAFSSAKNLQLTGAVVELVVGYATFIPSAILFGIGIPIRAVGGGLRQSAKKDYCRQQYSTLQTKSNLQLTMSTNSVGFTYTF